MMRFLDYQIYLASRLIDIFSTRGYAYLQGEPRTGKSPITLAMCEMSTHKNIAIICPKGARGDKDKNKPDGWYKFLMDEELNLTKSYTIFHYEEIYKRTTKKVISKGIEVEIVK